MADNYLITGYWGEPHVTAENDRGVNAAIFGTGRYVLPVGEQFKAEYIGNNTIRLYDGKLMDNGAAAGIPVGEYVDLLISNAGQGMHRNDLIVFQYKKDASTLKESGSFIVVEGIAVSGTPTDPDLTQADILSDKATLDQMALWRVPVSGATIAAPVQLFNVKNVLTPENIKDKTDSHKLVEQSRSASANYRPLLMHSTVSVDGKDPGGTTSRVFYNESIMAAPGEGKLKATTFVGALKGNADTATELLGGTTEGKITHGETDHWEGTFPPFTGITVNRSRANRFALMPAENILVERSTDAGVTWVEDTGLDNANKVNLLTNAVANDTLRIMNNLSVDERLRITLTVPAGARTEISQIYTEISTRGHGVRLDIEGARNSAPDTFSMLGTNVRLGGWSGPNVINIPKITWGASTGDHYGKIRLTYKISAVSSSQTGKAIVLAIKGYGHWAQFMHHNLAFEDCLYTTDHSGNATFPANLTAKTIAGMEPKDIFSLGGGTEIPNGTNLDDWKTPGNYMCFPLTAVNSVTNKPVPSSGNLRSFCLKVGEICPVNVGYPAPHLYQTLIDLNGYTAIRVWQGDKKTWTAWKELGGGLSGGTIEGALTVNGLLTAQGIDTSAPISYKPAAGGLYPFLNTNNMLTYMAQKGYGRVASGTYAGSNGDQVIACGFEPSMYILNCYDGQPSDGNYLAIYMFGSGLLVFNNEQEIIGGGIDSTGIALSGSSMNASGCAYSYIAFE